MGGQQLFPQWRILGPEEALRALGELSAGAQLAALAFQGCIGKGVLPVPAKAGGELS